MQNNLFDMPEIIVANVAMSRDQKVCGAILREVSYSAELLADFITTNKDLLSKLQRSSEIWIKPNITSSAEPSEGKTSQPLVLDGLLSTIKHLVSPTKKIVVADSSVIGTDTIDAAEKCGILDICDKHSVEFVDLRDTVIEHLDVCAPLEFDTLGIYSPFVKTSIFKINLAKFKSTYGSPVGLCLKNAKGIIPDDYKLAFHLRGVQRALCDLSRIVTWDLAVIEGFPASELGVPITNGLIIVSTNAVLADVVGCMCARIPLHEVFHIEWLAEFLCINRIKIEECEQFQKIIKENRPLRYTQNGVSELGKKYGIRIEDGAPCSGCIESLAKALSKINNNMPENIRLYMGADLKLENGVKLKSHDPIFLGNCSFDGVGMALSKEGNIEPLLQLWRKACKINGCPPTIDDMFQTLTKPAGEPKEQLKKITISERIYKAFDKRPLFALMSASKMKDLAQVIPAEETSYQDLGIEMHLAGEVITAAICHQMNWGFLRKQVKKNITKKTWWMPKNIGVVKKEDIEELLADYEKKDRIRATERAAMLRSLATIFEKHKTYTEVFDLTGNKDGNLTILFNTLNECSVFVEDPQQKKLQVLCHNLAWSNVVPGIDDFCQPAVDYHIMRLYLRRGEVVPTGGVGERYMCCSGQKRYKTVSAFRGIVAEAMKDVAKYSKMPIHVVNTIEWWIGRSICLKGEPDCLLENEKSTWLRSKYQRCPFYDNCLAIREDWLLSVSEPEQAGKFY